ncbi:MAG: PfkB family carbohydrate kinase [Candidatus Solibacter sp.]
MTIVSIGEILWDVFPDSVRLGGAPFNFAVHAHRLGHRVIFLSAVGSDEQGRVALSRAAALGVPTQYIQTVAGAPTGSVSVQLSGDGQPDFAIHRPAAYDQLSFTEDQLQDLSALRPDWIYFGTLYAMDQYARTVLHRVLSVLPHTRRFYDVNLRRSSYTTPLVHELLALSDAVKVNESEARMFPDLGEAPNIAITRGEYGCTVRIGAERADCPAYPIKVADTVGAGDAFAAAFLHGLGSGWNAARTGDYANRLGALVASRAGAVPPWSPAELEVSG